jgi:hypothetical protein
MDIEKQRLLLNNHQLMLNSQENNSSKKNNDSYLLVKSSIQHGADLNSGGRFYANNLNLTTGLTRKSDSSSSGRRDVMHQPSFKRLKTYIAQYENSARDDDDATTAAIEEFKSAAAVAAMHQHLKTSLPVSHQNGLLFLSAENQLKSLPYLIMNGLKNEAAAAVMAAAAAASSKVNAVSSKTNVTSSTATETSESNNKLLGLANIALEREESP